MRVAVFGEVGDLDLAAAAAADDYVVNELSWGGIVDRTTIHVEFLAYFGWSVFLSVSNPSWGFCLFFLFSHHLLNDRAFLEFVLW